MSISNISNWILFEYKKFTNLIFVQLNLRFILLWAVGKAGRTLRRSLVRWHEVTHQEFLWHINLNAPVTIGKFKCASERWNTGWHRVSWLTSCVEWYHSNLRSYLKFHIGHTSFQPALPRKNGAGYLFVQEHIQYRASFELIFMKFACLMRVHP